MKKLITTAAVLGLFAGGFAQAAPTIKNIQCKDPSRALAPVMFQGNDEGSANGFRFDLGNLEDVGNGQKYFHVIGSGRINTITSPSAGYVVFQGSFGTQLKIETATGATLLSGLIDVQNPAMGNYSPTRVTDYKMNCVIK